MVKIGLERIDIQKEVTVEALLDSDAIELVISSKFARKQRFKLKKIERLIYIRNVNSSFNKERLIEVNIYYQGHREIDVIGSQKQSVILRMLWLACYNPETDWRTEEVKMLRCSEGCGKQWRSKQGKPGWQKEEKKEEERKKQEEKKQKKEEKTKKKKNNRGQESSRRIGDLGLRKKWQSLKKWPRNWFLKGSTSGSMSSERKKVRGCQ